MACSISNSASRRLTVSNADRGDRFALHAVSGPLRDIPQFEEAAPGMGEAERRCDGLFIPLRVEQWLEATITVALKDAGEPGQMLLRVLAAPVA